VPTVDRSNICMLSDYKKLPSWMTDKSPWWINWNTLLLLTFFVQSILKFTGRKLIWLIVVASQQMFLYQKCKFEQFFHFCCWLDFTAHFKFNSSCFVDFFTYSFINLCRQGSKIWKSASMVHEAICIFAQVPQLSLNQGNCSYVACIAAGLLTPTGKER